MQHNLPIAIIGAGPIGLAAAAHLLERGERPLILEAGAAIGHAVRQAVTGQLGQQEHTVAVDEIVVATGFRPDLAILREVRLAIDPWLEAVQALAPLIDLNLHHCGTVPPHGARELAHSERDIFIVGMKSDGRAPTFLLATGYEQVRSVVAALAGDHVAAAQGELQLPLPHPGVCSAPPGDLSPACGGEPRPPGRGGAAPCCG